jgi:hypothetical protein
MRTFAETTTRGMHSLTNHSRNFTFQTAHSHKTRFRTLAAGFARGLACWFCPLQSEGAGNAGRPMRPIAACAGIVVERTRVSQVTPENVRHSPRNGLRLTSCSSRRSGFFVTVIPEKLASQELDASVEASEPHDFAVRLRCSRQQHCRRPPHPAPTSVTTAKRPSVWDGTAAI